MLGCFQRRQAPAKIYLVSSLQDGQQSTQLLSRFTYVPSKRRALCVLFQLTVSLRTHIAMHHSPLLALILRFT